MGRPPIGKVAMTAAERKRRQRERRRVTKPVTKPATPKPAAATTKLKAEIAALQAELARLKAEPANKDLLHWTHYPVTAHHFHDLEGNPARVYLAPIAGDQNYQISVPYIHGMERGGNYRGEKRPGLFTVVFGKIGGPKTLLGETRTIKKAKAMALQHFQRINNK